MHTRIVLSCYLLFWHVLLHCIHIFHLCSAQPPRWFDHKQIHGTFQNPNVEYVGFGDVHILNKPCWFRVFFAGGVFHKPLQGSLLNNQYNGNYEGLYRGSCIYIYINIFQHISPVPWIVKQPLQSNETDFKDWSQPQVPQQIFESWFVEWDLWELFGAWHIHQPLRSKKRT